MMATHPKSGNQQLNERETSFSMIMPAQNSNADHSLVGRSLTTVPKRTCSTHAGSSTKDLAVPWARTIFLGYIMEHNRIFQVFSPDHYDIRLPYARYCA